MTESKAMTIDTDEAERAYISNVEANKDYEAATPEKKLTMIRPPRYSSLNDYIDKFMNDLANHWNCDIILTEKGEEVKRVNKPVKPIKANKKK